MDIIDYAKIHFPNKVKRLTEFVKKDALDIMGEEAINHFQESFVNEGFTDETLNKWPEVERRKPESAWFGHSGQARKFRSARTTAKILTGETGELMNRKSFSYKYIERGVRVINNKPYAAVHQYGRMAKIYGKKAFTMLRRPFVGRSKVMVRKINDELRTRLIEIINS